MIGTIVKLWTFINGSETADATKVNQNFDPLYAATNEVITTINNAAGTAATLPDRLDAGLNPDGTVKDNISGGAEFISTVTPTYATASTFTVEGDKTGIFLATRRVSAVVDGVRSQSEVDSSLYSEVTGLTTVTIADAILTADLTRIDVSIIRPQADGGAVSRAMLGIDESLAGVQASDFATAEQGATADAALPADATAVDSDKLNGQKIISGDVNADGTIAVGTGFTVNKTGAGAYDIAFTDAFSGTPVIVVGLGFNAGFGNQAIHLSENEGGFSVATASSAAYADKHFSFIAIGEA